LYKKVEGKRERKRDGHVFSRLFSSFFETRGRGGEDSGKNHSIPLSWGQRRTREKRRGGGVHSDG